MAKFGGGPGNVGVPNTSFFGQLAPLTIGNFGQQNINASNEQTVLNAGAGQTYTYGPNGELVPKATEF